MLVASCHGRTRPNTRSSSPSRKFKSKTSVWVTSATNEQRNTKRTTTGSDLSLLLFPLYPQPFQRRPPTSPQIIQARRNVSDQSHSTVWNRSNYVRTSEFHRRRGLKPGRESVKLTAGGLDETSYVTRLIPATSFVMREDIFRRTSGGNTYLPKRERFRVKITKHKRSDRLGKGPRTKNI